MHDKHNLVSGNFLNFTPGQHVDADLPFLFQQLLPYISNDELDLAQKQLGPTIAYMHQ